MAAPSDTFSIGVISLDEESKAAMNHLADALDRHKGAQDSTPEPSLPDPYVSSWPIRTHPPLVIATCPYCAQAIEANPVIWEIVVDPTSTLGALTVRGTMQHEHEDKALVRWPFAAAFTPAPEAPPVYDSEAGALREGAAAVDNDRAFATVREAESVDEAAYLALGAASACWDDLSEAGVFDSERAKLIGEALTERIERHVDERVQAAEDERVRLEQIIYRARTYVAEREQRLGGYGTDSPLAVVRDLLAAVDGQDSPAAKRLRGDNR